MSSRTSYKCHVNYTMCARWERSADNKVAGYIISEKFVKGDIKLGFIITKGQLEISVVCAKGLPTNINHQKPGKSMSDIYA